MARPNKRTTLREVAEATGLSTAAVSYALRGKHVSKETEERVRKAAADSATRPTRSPAPSPAAARARSACSPAISRTCGSSS